MQFPVPQNIDMEDKIIGPMTLVQFLYVLGGGIIDYLLFLSLKTGILFWVLAIPIAIVALALAFLKIQDQPLMYFVKSGLVYLSRPKVRLWQRQGLARKILQAPTKKEIKQAPILKKGIEKSELEKLAYNLDTGARKN